MTGDARPASRSRVARQFKNPANFRGWKHYLLVTLRKLALHLKPPGACARVSDGHRAGSFPSLVLLSGIWILVCAVSAAAQSRSHQQPAPPAVEATATLPNQEAPQTQKDKAAAQQAAQSAYAALRDKDYDAAVAGFTAALRLAPDRATLRKDLAYTFLKIGESEAARDQFGEVVRLDPADSHSALEYAFLCYETRRQAEARRVFDRLRKSSDSQIRATAESAFQNIDRQLAEDIARWSQVVSQTAGNYSAEHELARLCDERDDLGCAETHYLKSWHVRPGDRSILIDLSRVWRASGQIAQANAAVLAASRADEPRLAEEAREALPARYPYVSEFRQALELDPANTGLRRELAFLLLEMKQSTEAEAEFEKNVEVDPGDDLSAAQLGLLRLARGDRAGALPLLKRVMQSRDKELAARVRAALNLPAESAANTVAAAPETATGGNSAKAMAEKSYRLGYLKDALRYYQAAHEADPGDYSVALKLGWTYNLLHEDEQALQWFGVARQSPDSSVASEAETAYRNLRPAVERFRLTVWAMPFYSSRWSDTFSYGQAKTEMRIAKLPFRPYVSLRFVGDTRSADVLGPDQYLSESSIILAGGVSSTLRHGITLWAEAGRSIGYLHSDSTERTKSDYRGGVAYGRGWGRVMGANSGGWFTETHADGVFVSRFDDDFLIYSQSRAGYTLPSIPGIHTQLCAIANITTDVKQLYWANTAEAGPSFQMRAKFLPPGSTFTADAVRGFYMINRDNPRHPNFFDFRAGFWYAFTH